MAQRLKPAKHQLASSIAANCLRWKRNVPICNNLAENAIRPLAVGRKNWLFCDTVMGAESSAIVYSLVETAKANGIERFQYLHYILTELPYLGKSPAHVNLDLLLPWNPYVKQQFAPVKAADD